MTEQDLVSRLKTYEAFLQGKIAEEQKISGEESMMGSIAADGRRDIYQSSLDKLYELVPEVKIDYKKP